MYKGAAFAIVLALVLPGLGGCYQSADVSLHTPGVYKGAKDPLLAVEGTATQQNRLAERFNAVQRDR